MHRSRAYLASILVVVFLLSSVSLAPGATREEIEASRQRAEQAREAATAAEARAADLREETKVIDEQIRAIDEQIRELDPQIAEATSRTQRLLSEVRDLEAKVADKEAEIAETEAEYDFQQTLLNDRMTASYKQGTLFYLDLLLDSKTINDLITRTTLVQRVMSSNKDIAVQLIHTGKQLETARRPSWSARCRHRRRSVPRRRPSRRTFATCARSASRRSAASRQPRTRRPRSCRQVRRTPSAGSAQAEEEEAAASRMEAELRASGLGWRSVRGGVMAWPVPGGSLTSPMACAPTRSSGHPALPSRHRHQQGNGGTIVAAGDGTVIRASYGWNGGYGNIIVIDHGDGLTTLYAHILDGRPQGLQRPGRHQGPGHRARGIDRLLDRSAPALRGPHQRRLYRPDRLPAVPGRTP
jgi:murein DD-endopeptidase MepM/ murein hydrolase activator NlpD